MNRRVRHFNSAKAGANLVLDARYINQSDNTTVSSWTDLSGTGSNAVQSNASYRPIFKTNILNGNPAVEFDNTDDRLSTTATLNQSYWVIAVHVPLLLDSNWHSIISKGTDFHRSIFLCISGGFNSPANSYAQYNSSSGLQSSYSGVATLNAASIISCGTLSNVTFLYRNSVVGTNFGSAATQTPDTDMYICGYPPNLSIYHGACRIAHVSVFNVNYSNSLRRKIEQCLAFSFKIACS